MSSKTVETANPQQYLRLLLMRLLETQQQLRPLINQPTFALLKVQYLTNESTLSEIKSWLEEQDSISPLGPSASTASSVGTSGRELSQPSSDPTPSSSGYSRNPFVWRTYQPTEPAGTSQVRSSLPSGVTLPPSAEIIRGRVIFRTQSLPEKPPSISDGGTSEDES